MVQLLLLREELVRDLDHRVVVAEAERVLVARQLIVDEALEVVLHVQHEVLLDQRLLQQHHLYVKDIGQLGQAKQQSNFG